MPSCTIVPGAMATSVTLEPQAWPTVAMSIPWSSVHWLGGTTRDNGVSGNTRSLLLVGPGAGVLVTPLPLAARCTADRRAAAVRLPTVPLGGLSPLALWNLRT